MTKRKLTNWNETKYHMTWQQKMDEDARHPKPECWMIKYDEEEDRYIQPNTDRGLPTLWAVLFIVLSAAGLWTLGIWGAMVILGGMR